MDAHLGCGVGGFFWCGLGGGAERMRGVAVGKGMVDGWVAMELGDGGGDEEEAGGLY